MAPQIRVLLADDETVFLESLAKVLSRRGMVVATAGDGMAALERLASEPFDIIVLDMRMPRLDGLATLAAIRQTDVLTPVLLLSGHADLEQATAALRHGASDFLLKPCPVDTLISAIEDAAEHSALRRQLSQDTHPEE